MNPRPSQDTTALLSQFRRDPRKLAVVLLAAWAHDAQDIRQGEALREHFIHLRLPSAKDE